MTADNAAYVKPAQSAECARQEEPLLGLATTLAMLLELEARFRISTPDTAARAVVLNLLEDLPDRTLDYRTVDS